jgi:signal transduction histidine kinase
MRLWTDNTLGGHLLRHLFPKSLILFILLDLLTEWGAHKGFYSPDKISPLLILCCSGMLFILFYRAAILLNYEHQVRLTKEAALLESNALLRIDITERKRIEDALKTHETQLEKLVASRTAEVNELLGHMESVREEEKRAIARELHDDLGSALTALNMHLAILFKKMPAESVLMERAGQIKTILSSVTEATRRIQVGLRPDKLDIFGIKFAIAEQVLEFEKHSGIACKANLPDEELAYQPQMDIALFRTVQEALSNVSRHAMATYVEVILDDNDTEVTLTIRDNGIGITQDSAESPLTHGVRSMRERATYLGGEIRIFSREGKGTTVSMTLPKIQSSAAEIIEDTDVIDEQ